MSNGMNCEVCGSDNVRIEICDQKFEYKGKEIIIPDYKKVVCETCGEAIPDPASVKESVPILRDAQRKIDGFLTSGEMRDIRKNFGLTQNEFSEILGGGGKAFARYENGSVMQSKPMDNLLRILRAMPQALNVLRSGVKYNLEIPPKGYTISGVGTAFIAADDIQEEEKKAQANSEEVAP